MFILAPIDVSFRLNELGLMSYILKLAVWCSVWKCQQMVAGNSSPYYSLYKRQILCKISCCLLWTRHSRPRILGILVRLCKQFSKFVILCLPILYSALLYLMLLTSHRTAESQHVSNECVRYFQFPKKWARVETNGKAPVRWTSLADSVFRPAELAAPDSIIKKN
jgi:hypothetical protein